MLDPVPVSVRPQTTIELSGRLLLDSKHPVRLFVGKPDRSVITFPKPRSNADGDFLFRVPFNETGRYDVEIVADLKQGPETIVLFPVFVGTRPGFADSLLPGISSPGKELKSDDSLLYHLNLARREMGIPTLRRDPRLDRIAQDHVLDMAEHDIFGHFSPQYGSLQNRLVRAHLSPARFAENVARSSTVLRVHKNLMRSPSHRLAALSLEFTHVGIGIVRRGENLLATEIFARWE
jgi:uncharacterized protein YkwD